jgi:HAMP domain-containing protein
MAEIAKAEERPKYRRRIIPLVRPAYQLRVAATILAFILAYSLLLAFLTFYPMQQEFAAAATPEQQFWLARQVVALHQRFWPSVLVVGILVAIQSLFVTHRLVGAAYHIQRVMEAFTAGRYETRAHLRRGDRLTELESAVNALGEALLHREAARREEAIRLRALIGELSTGLRGATLPLQAQNAVGELERLVADRPHGN